MTHQRNTAQTLAQYLRKRLERLEQCNAGFETKHSDDERQVCEDVSAGIYMDDDPDLGRILFHMKYVYANTFRYCLLGALCSFLEEALKAIGPFVGAGYDSRLKQKKGNWLVRHIAVLQDITAIDCAPVQGSVDKFCDLITLRNCVMHSGGNVDSDRDPQAVRKAVQRVETAEQSRDNFLFLGDQVVPEAIIAAEEIADHILKCILGGSIV